MLKKGTKAYAEKKAAEYRKRGYDTRAVKSGKYYGTETFGKKRYPRKDGALKHALVKDGFPMNIGDLLG